MKIYKFQKTIDILNQQDEMKRYCKIAFEKYKNSNETCQNFIIEYLNTNWPYFILVCEYDWFPHCATGFISLTEFFIKFKKWIRIKNCQEKIGENEGFERSIINFLFRHYINSEFILFSTKSEIGRAHV